MNTQRETQYGQVVEAGALSVLATQINRVSDIHAALQELAGRLVGASPSAAGTASEPPTRYGGILGACEQSARDLRDRLNDMELLIQAMGAALR